MKTKKYFLFALLVVLSISLSAQKTKENKPYEFDEGVYLEYGFMKTISTKNILFPNWQKNNSQVMRQTLTSEWGAPIMGSYFDIAYNLNNGRPFFFGFSYQRQKLFTESSSKISHFAYSINEPLRLIEYTHKNNVFLLNYSLFSETTLINGNKFLLYMKNNLGLSVYSSQNKVKWNYQYTGTNITEKLKKHNIATLSTDIGLGLRMRLTENISFKGLFGYHMQLPNSFYRKNFVAEYELEVDKTKSFRSDEKWILSGSKTPQRPIKLQHENLYFQLGVSIRIDKGLLHEKPVLYLYPTDTTDVNVKVHLNQHEFAFSYPKYPYNGWNVVATPNGDIIDPISGKKYYSLFWETQGQLITNDLNQGYVISGCQTEAFLERKLEKLGLNYKEKNEFIIYWLPQMQNNPYNAIYFAFEEYEAESKLDIQPQPDTVIRIMMLWEPLDHAIDLTPQNLPQTPERTGFIAVEWGGSKGAYFEKNKKDI